MANGKPGDHPITDWAHKRYSFPEDLETRLRELDARGRLGEVSEAEFFAWYDALNVLENAKTRVNVLLNSKKP